MRKSLRENVKKRRRKRERERERGSILCVINVCDVITKLNHGEYKFRQDQTRDKIIHRSTNNAEFGKIRY